MNPSRRPPFLNVEDPLKVMANQTDLATGCSFEYNRTTLVTFLFFASFSDSYGYPCSSLGWETEATLAASVKNPHNVPYHRSDKKFHSETYRRLALYLKAKNNIG